MNYTPNIRDVTPHDKCTCSNYQSILATNTNILEPFLLYYLGLAVVHCYLKIIPLGISPQSLSE